MPSSPPPLDWEAIKAAIPLWALLLGIAVVGGIVSYYRKLRDGVRPHFALMEFIGEVTTSAFAGALVGLVAIHMGTPFYLTMALCGIAGHMGGRMIFVLENWASGYINRNRHR